jgi:hypothetical protein
MWDAAQQHIRQFTWERTAGIYREVIEGLLSGGKGLLKMEERNLVHPSLRDYY